MKYFYTAMLATIVMSNQAEALGLRGMKDHVKHIGNKVNDEAHKQVHDHQDEIKDKVRQQIDEHQDDIKEEAKQKAKDAVKEHAKDVIPYGNVVVPVAEKIIDIAKAQKSSFYRMFRGTLEPFHDIGRIDDPSDPSPDHQQMNQVRHIKGNKHHWKGHETREEIEEQEQSSQRLMASNSEGTLEPYQDIGRTDSDTKPSHSQMPRMRHIKGKKHHWKGHETRSEIESAEQQVEQAAQGRLLRADRKHLTKKYHKGERKAKKAEKRSRHAMKKAEKKSRHAEKKAWKKEHEKIRKAEHKQEDKIIKEIEMEAEKEANDQIDETWAQLVEQYQYLQDSSAYWVDDTYSQIKNQIDEQEFDKQLIDTHQKAKDYVFEQIDYVNGWVDENGDEYVDFANQWVDKTSNDAIDYTNSWLSYLNEVLDTDKEQTESDVAQKHVLTSWMDDIKREAEDKIKEEAEKEMDEEKDKYITKDNAIDKMTDYVNEHMSDEHKEQIQKDMEGLDGVIEIQKFTNGNSTVEEAAESIIDKASHGHLHYDDVDKVAKHVETEADKVDEVVEDVVSDVEDVVSDEDDFWN